MTGRASDSIAKQALVISNLSEEIGNLRSLSRTDLQGLQYFLVFSTLGSYYFPRSLLAANSPQSLYESPTHFCTYAVSTLLLFHTFLKILASLLWLEPDIFPIYSSQAVFEYERILVLSAAAHKLINIQFYIPSKNSDVCSSRRTVFVLGANCFRKEKKVTLSSQGRSFTNSF